MARTIVVGAGLGGLSTAIRLAARGWEVTVYDKNPQPGGRMSTVTAGGFTWDVGPTLIMMPEVLHELFAAAGRRLEDYLDLRRVDPYYRVVFEEGGHLDLTGNLPDMVRNVEAIETGAGRWYSIPRRCGASVAPDPGRHRRAPFAGGASLASPRCAVCSCARGPFDSGGPSSSPPTSRRRKLRQAFSFQTLYLGNAAERAPAAYMMIPFVEAALGVWYPMGGVHQIAQAWRDPRGELGVDIRLDTAVDKHRRRRHREPGE